MLQKILSRYYVLPERDQNALKLLAGFFGLCLIYAVFMLHGKANKIEQSALNTQEKFFWMRSQADNIKTANQASKDARNIVFQTAEPQNIRLDFQDSDNKFTASHKNANVLGSFLVNLETRGLQIKTLSMQSNADKTITANIQLENL